MPHPAKPRLPARLDWVVSGGGGGSSLPRVALLQAPGCRSSCCSSGLEPSSGTAAARTTQVAWRRSVGSAVKWGCGDTGKPSSSPPQQHIREDLRLALPFREHSGDKNKIQKSILTSQAVPSGKSFSHDLVLLWGSLSRCCLRYLL